MPKLTLTLPLFILTICVFAFSISSHIPQKQTKDFKFNRSVSCDSIPILNKQIIVFVKNALSKKIGRGECWDLAAQALNKVGATWDKNYVFGREVDIKKDCIYPGDVIQFEGIEIEYEKKGILYKEELEHHTAIIYKVKDKTNFVVAEQNTSTLGKKVGLSALELKSILKGSYKIYRPYK
jgi:hypothetical protein